MPIPSAQFVSTIIKAQLASAGAPGVIAPGPVTQAPFNPIHALVDLMVTACWPQVELSWLSGYFTGSLGGPSCTVYPPASYPILTGEHMQLSVTAVLPLVPASAQALAAQNGWLGPFAPTLSNGVGMGVLMAFMGSPLGISGQVGDPVFTGLTGGFLEFTRTALTASSLLGPVQAAWASYPDLGPGNRLLLANAMVGGMVEALNSIHLSCGIVNPAPAVPIVPGVPYPQSLPLVFL